MKPSEILIKAKALIDTPEKWTTRAYARIKNGRSTAYADIDACVFCSLGALAKSAEQDSGIVSIEENYPATDYLCRAIDSDEAIDVVRYNDTHTHAEVMAKWDEAIALAESDEADSQSIADKVEEL